MEFQDSGTAFYPKTMPANGQTVWSAFPATTGYFAPSQKEFMFNVVADDLEEGSHPDRKHGKAGVRIVWLVYGSGWQ